MTDAPPRGADGVDNPREEAQGELALARMALADGDLQHAASHLAAAIEHAPDLPEAHELLAALAARTPDGGLSLFPLEGEQGRLGDVVAYAYLIGPADPDNALVMLAAATAFDPTKPWADTTWLRERGGGGFSPDAIVQSFAKVMPALPTPTPEGLRRANAVYFDLAEQAVRAYPDHGLVHGTAAGIARRLGPIGEAVRWGERAFHLEPGKLTAVWYAYALKADGRLDEALAVMGQALRTNPYDLDLSSDIASWLTAAGRLDEALEVIEAAMAVDPTYDCAVHTAHRLRFLRDGDARHLVALADFVRENPPSTHDHSDLADCCLDRDWLGAPIGTTESCITMLYQFPEEQRATVRLTRAHMSALEVPSAVTLVRRRFPGIALEIGGGVPADMTGMLRPGRPLWHYDGLVAAPAIPPPPAPSATLLADVTAITWPHPVAAYNHALPLGALPAGDLRALLVHPPAKPESWAEDVFGDWWVRCAQVFACLGLLHCEEAGDTAARRAELAEIAWGVEDWTTEAALFALVTAAWVDPGCRPEVAETVGDRFVTALRASQNRAVTILGSLATLVRITPEMPPRLLELAGLVLSDGDSDADSSPSQPPPTRSDEPTAPARRSLFGRAKRLLRR
jgi:tetratricopeptide (TPR) repeat protein